MGREAKFRTDRLALPPNRQLEECYIAVVDSTEWTPCLND